MQDGLKWSVVNDIRMIGSCFRKSQSLVDFDTRGVQISAFSDESLLTGLSAHYDKVSSEYEKERLIKENHL